MTLIRNIQNFCSRQSNQLNNSNAHLDEYDYIDIGYDNNGTCWQYSEFKFNDLKASFYLTVKGKLGAQLSVTEKLERRQLFKTDVIKLVASKVKELTAPEAPNIRMNRDEALCYDENLQFSHALAKYEYQRQVYTEIIEFLENPANDNGA